MTERTVPTGSDFSFWRQRSVAFFSALLLAPLAMAVIGGVTLPIGIGFIVLFSIPFGAPAYLLAFAPLAWLAIVKGATGAGWMALVGSLANLAAAAVLGTWVFFTEGWSDAREAVTFINGFGLVFAPLYGALFGAFYGWMKAEPFHS